MATRENLLNGMYIIQNYVQKLEGLRQAQAEIRTGYRPKFEKLSTDQYSDITYWVALAIRIYVLMLIMCGALLSGSYVRALLTALLSLYLYIKRGEKSFRKKLACIALVLIAISLVFAGYGLIECAIFPKSFGFLRIPLTLMMFAVPYFLAKLICRRDNDATIRQNAEIDEQNALIEAHNQKVRSQELSVLQQIRATEQEMLSYGSGWFPEDYYNSYAVQFFIDALRNHRAEANMVDLVNKFEDSEYKREMLEQQRRAADQAEESARIQRWHAARSAAADTRAAVQREQQLDSMRRQQQTADSINRTLHDMDDFFHGRSKF